MKTSRTGRHAPIREKRIPAIYRARGTIFRPAAFRDTPEQDRQTTQLIIGSIRAVTMQDLLAIALSVLKHGRLKVHVLDTCHLGRAHILAVTALETDGGLVLFDVGPESAFQEIVGELRKLGFQAADVRQAFLSHIHFDHAGAAWRFAELGAMVYVHPRGVPHLIDPTKLIA